jgi:hypothetical protein
MKYLCRSRQADNLRLQRFRPDVVISTRSPFSLATRGVRREHGLECICRLETADQQERCLRHLGATQAREALLVTVRTNAVETPQLYFTY